MSNSEPEITLLIQKASTFLESINRLDCENFWGTLSLESKGYCIGYMQGSNQVNMDGAFDPSHGKIVKGTKGLLVSVNNIFKKNIWRKCI
ncbi:MAG: hypothetical protein ACYDG3_12330 [Bacillati bacterium]